MANRHIKRCSASLVIKEKQIKTTIRYHLTAAKRAQVPNTGKDVEKRELYTLLEGMYIGAVTAENSMEVAQKIKITTTI